MVMRGISLYILVGYLFIGCPSYKGCNGTEIHSKCEQVFQVDIDGPQSVDEGETITLKCIHNITNLNLTFEWLKDRNLMKGNNESNLTLTDVLSEKTGYYVCRVNNSCGSYQSSPHHVTVNSGSVVILVVCGLSAVALILIMGLAMKFKMKRDNAKHKERRNRRAQVGHSGGPAPITPRES